MKDPDKAHEEYFKHYNDEEHMSASKETLNLLSELERRLEGKLDTMKDKIDEQLSGKVSFKVFSWVLGILMAVVLGVLGIIYNRVEGIYEQTNVTNIKVSEIQGKLEPYDWQR